MTMRGTQRKSTAKSAGVPRESVASRLIERRTLLVLALGAMIALTLTAGAPTAGAQGPVKIGFLAPLSGAIAQAGKDMYSGCELYWEESGWQLAGRKL
jgi:branched-chain amino acid transport system substrate-binding protein